MLAKVIALIVPVGFDAFGVSAALAVAGLTRGRLLRIWLLLTAAEAAMPVLGILAGRTLAHVGRLVDVAAAVVLLLFAVRMMREDDDELRAIATGGRGALTAGVLALTVGLDELVIGVELGILHAPAAPVIIAVLAQALTVSLLGLRLGTRIGERLREGAEWLGAGILALVAIGLLVEAIAGG